MLDKYSQQYVGLMMDMQGRHQVDLSVAVPLPDSPITNKLIMLAMKSQSYNKSGTPANF